jgi:hypothetical protein
VVSGRRLPCSQHGEVVQTYRVITESSRPSHEGGFFLFSLGVTLLQKLVSPKEGGRNKTWVQLGSR